MCSTRAHPSSGAISGPERPPSRASTSWWSIRRFHDAGREDQSLGQAFVQYAARVLRKGGTLWLVANRHLPYEATLSDAFRTATSRAEAHGFKVYEAVK